MRISGTEQTNKAMLLWQLLGAPHEKLPLTTHYTHPILFINFSNMYKRYHAMGVVK